MPIRQAPIVSLVTPELLAAFERTMTARRMQTYLVAAGFRPHTAMALYLWNAAIGQSFHFPLQALEIALRNVVSAALVSRLGPDWWSDPQSRSILGKERCVDIDKTRQRIERKYGHAPLEIKWSRP